MRTKVEFFYDVVSPYTWFAFEVMCRYKTHWNMDLIFRPFFLGGVMKSTGNRPPMMVPSKALYMQKDLLRNASYFSVPIKLMEDPFTVMVEKGTLRPQRFLTAVQEVSPNHLEATSKELWKRIWSSGEDIVENKSLADAAGATGMDQETIEKCLMLMNDASIKGKLAQATEDALSYGGFGAPTIVVHTSSGPEMVFGSDRFPLIAELMGEKWMGPNPGVKSSL